MVAGAESGLFAGLTAAEQEAVQERLRERRFAPGAILLQQGQLSGELHIVRSGTVSVSTGDSLGHADELARLGPGQIVGEMSLLTGQPHSATVTAISPTETYVLARDDFLALVANSARLAQNISRTLSERLVRTSRRQVETDRAAVVAVASPCAPAAAPVLALNLAVGLARQSRRRVLLAVDDATLDGPLHPLRGAALPSLDEVARDPAAAAAHRAAAPGHPALPGVQLCRLGAAVPAGGGDGGGAGPLDPLADVYGYIVLGPAYDTGDAGEARPGWAAGASRALVAAPAERLGQACTVRAVERLQGAGARADLVATDLPRQPSVGELAALGAPAGARVLRGLPVALGALADEPLPPLVRRERRGAAAAAIDWLARDVAGLKVGLALGAGSARGFAHVGVLRVLEREGVPVDALAGSSIGAVVAAFWACGLPADAVGQALHAAGRGLLRVTVPYASLFSNRNMRLGIRRVVGSRLIEDLPDPFAAVAVDLVTREPVALHHGPLWHAVLASASLPGIFPPVLHGGRALVDGVVRDPIPTGVAADLGGDVVIGVRLSPAPGARDAGGLVPAAVRANLLDVVFTMLDVMQEAIESHGSQRASLIIHPQVPKVTLRQFQEGSALVEVGEAAAEEALPTLRRLLPWLAE